MSTPNQYPFDRSPLPRRLIVAKVTRRQRKGLGGDISDRMADTTLSASEDWNVTDAPAAFHSDAPGSPSESACSEEKLTHILAEREEWEIKKMRATVRRREMTEANR